MSRASCTRCTQFISADQTVTFDGDRLAHFDCQRPRDLTQEERALLFHYCFDHTVAECSRCAEDFRRTELASDLIGNRRHLCPRCRADLTEQVREHLYGCTKLPGDIRCKAREARAAMRRLIMEPTNGFTERTDLTNGLTRDAAELAKAQRRLREAQSALGELRELMSDRGRLSLPRVSASSRLPPGGESAPGAV